MNKKNINLSLFLVSLTTILILLRIPNFFEPYFDSNEMLILSLRQAVKNGSIIKNPTPLPITLYPISILSKNLFYLKLILTFLSIFTVIIFYELAKKFFPGKRMAHFIATSVFAILSTLPTFGGNTFNSIFFSTSLSILGFYLFFNLKKDFPSGLAFSLSTLTSIFGLFSFIAVYSFVLLKEAPKNIAKRLLYLSTGFFLPSFPVLLFFYKKGLNKPFSNLNFSYFSLAILFFFLLSFLIIFFLRKKLPKNFILATSWLFSSIFPLTLVQNPQPFYILSAIPPLSLLIAIVFGTGNKEQILSFIPLTFFFFVLYSSKFWYYQVFPYYERFTKFSLGKIDRESYFHSFGSHIPLSYRVASFVKESIPQNEKVFIWEDKNQIVYALSGHSSSIPFSNPQEILDELKKDPPRLIIILPKSPPLSEVYEFVKDNYLMIGEIDSALIWLKI